MIDLQMAEAKYSIGHSRKPKGRIGVGGQPILSWDNDIELHPTSSLGSTTSAQNTSHNLKESNRHVVAQTWIGGSKQAFGNSRKKDKDSPFATASFLSKNAPVKVSVSGEWALQECEEFTNWTNLLMRRGHYRVIADIRKSICDGQTLVHILEILSGEKIPGVYARPITRAQKLENLQLCMSFMGNRSINLQGIYVGDLIDGNVKSVLSLCGNLRKRFETSSFEVLSRVGSCLQTLLDTIFAFAPPAHDMFRHNLHHHQFVPNKLPSGMADFTYLGSHADTPELVRPASSGSVKDNEQPKSYKTMNGHVINGVKELDGDLKPHGNSSGYHSEEYSPTRIGVPQLGLEMPGMMMDPEALSTTTSTVHPTDIIVSTTKLDRKAVYQSGTELRKNVPTPQFQQNQEDSDFISPSVEDRLRSLLCTPNPGGQCVEEDTEDDFMILPRPVSDGKGEDRFDVEERLKSLLDAAAEGFSENDDDDDYDDEQRRIETLRELDAIGYMPSHPSEKMRNIPSRNERQDSFTGRSKPRSTKLPTPPVLRRMHNAQANQASHERGTERQRKMSVTSGPCLYMTKTTISSSELPKPVLPNFQAQSNRRAKSFYTEKDNLGGSSPPLRGRSSSHSEFLQQVASRLENEVGNRETTTASSTSISPADTPMLPELSPSSSIASLVIDSSSDSSGMITPVRNYYNKLKAAGHKSPGNSGSSTPKKRGRGKTGLNNISGYGRTKSTNDLESIRTQIQSLESMYTDVLSLLDDGVNDKKLKAKDKQAGNLQKTDEMKAGIVAFSKQRSKDIKAVNKRFGRLESHVVTLARSVAHLSSELRSQAALSEDLEEMRKDINRLRTWQCENESKKAGGVEQSLQYAVNLKRVNKLRKIFGEEPPLLVIFLKKLGYERFSPNFGAEQIGILELPYLNEERLQSLGIPLGPRLRIMEEANKLL